MNFGRLLTTSFLAAIAFAGVSGQAHAIPIATVGNVDTFLASAALPNSGDGTEEAYIAGVLGLAIGDITYTKMSNSGGGNWAQIDENSNIYAIDFGVGSDVEWFLIKTGNAFNAPSGHEHFLYRNDPNVRYGVIDLSSFGSGFVLENIGKVSHVALSSCESSSTSPVCNPPPPTCEELGNCEEQLDPVPEPASMLLLGTGLAGLVARRKLRKR